MLGKLYKIFMVPKNFNKNFIMNRPPCRQIIPRLPNLGIYWGLFSSTVKLAKVSTIFDRGPFYLFHLVYLSSVKTEKVAAVHRGYFNISNGIRGVNTARDYPWLYAATETPKIRRELHPRKNSLAKTRMIITQVVLSRKIYFAVLSTKIAILKIATVDSWQRMSSC